MQQTDCLKLVDDLIEGYRSDPVDLLNINDQQGEYNYLRHARLSYQRTLRDLSVVMKRQGGAINVLEVGAYLGLVSIACARQGYNVTAADLPEYMQNERLRDKYRSEGVETMSLNLSDYLIPAADKSFDVVIMCETLEHLNFNPLPVLREIHRVLADQGCLYVSLPNLATLVNRVKLLLGGSIHNPISDFSAQLQDDDNMIVGIHWREYTGKELCEMLDLTGFLVEKHYYFTSTESSSLAKCLYSLFPRLRPNQTAIARKQT